MIEDNEFVPLSYNAEKTTLKEHYKSVRLRLNPISPPKQKLAEAFIPEKIKPVEPKPIEKPLKFKEGIEPIKIPARQSKLIIQDVASKHNLTVEDIVSPSRKKHISEARQETYYRLRQAGYSWPQCARFCGVSDHTSAIYGAGQYEAKLKQKETE